jgi:hypothetical protein
MGKFNIKRIEKLGGLTMFQVKISNMWIGSPLAGFCEHITEPLGSIQPRNFLTNSVTLNFLRKII